MVYGDGRRDELQRPVPSVLGPEDQGLTVQDSVPFLLSLHRLLPYYTTYLFFGNIMILWHALDHVTMPPPEFDHLGGQPQGLV